MAEWPVIRDIIVSGEFRYIKMLIIEIHTPQQKVPLIVEEYLQVSKSCLKRWRHENIDDYVHVHACRVQPLVPPEVSSKTRLVSPRSNWNAECMRSRPELVHKSTSCVMQQRPLFCRCCVCCKDWKTLASRSSCFIHETIVVTCTKCWLRRRRATCSHSAAMNSSTSMSKCLSTDDCIEIEPYVRLVTLEIYLKWQFVTQYKSIDLSMHVSPTPPPPSTGGCRTVHQINRVVDVNWQF